METSHQIECLKTLTKELQALQNRKFLHQRCCDISNVSRTNHLSRNIKELIKELDAGKIQYDKLHMSLVDYQHEFLKLAYDMLLYCNDRL